MAASPPPSAREFPRRPPSAQQALGHAAALRAAWPAVPRQYSRIGALAPLSRFGDDMADDAQRPRPHSAPKGSARSRWRAGRPAPREPRQQQRARRFRHQPKVDERQREASALLRHHQVAVEEHGRPDADALPCTCATSGGHRGRNGAEQAPHRNVLRSRGRRGEEVGEVVARGESPGLRRLMVGSA
jgi:hypothetical protein